MVDCCTECGVEITEEELQATKDIIWRENLMKRVGRRPHRCGVVESVGGEQETKRCLSFYDLCLIVILLSLVALMLYMQTDPLFVVVFVVGSVIMRLLQVLWP